MPYFTAEKVKKRKGIYAHYGPVLAGGRVMVVSSDGSCAPSIRPTAA
jgi:hypothetical protein